jgi:hypothetical protein
MAMSKAYNTSMKIFEQVSVRNQPGLIEQLQAISPGEIVVVKGTYDHIETILDTMKVPYDYIQPGEMATHNGGRVMFINCRTYGEGKSPQAAKDFVEAGGRMVTTDWAVSLLTHAFPKRLHKTMETGDDVVEIQCSTDIARRLVGLNYAQCHPKWWLEGSSHIYDIGNGVVPLITSAEMEDRYGKPYVMVGFAEGKGEVFHFISHLELQRTHLRSKADKEGLEGFLKKMDATKTGDMEDAKVAELEAAYSTINTLAHLCVPQPILNTGGKSVLVGKSKSAAKSQKLG